MSSAQSGVVLISRYMESVLNGDYATMSELLSDKLLHNLSRSGIEVKMATKEDAIQYAKDTGKVDVRFHDVFESGDKVVCRYEYTISGEVVPGAQPGTSTNVTGIAIVRIENGKIREIWQEQDVLGMLLGLGMTVLRPEARQQ